MNSTGNYWDICNFILFKIYKHKVCGSKIVNKYKICILGNTNSDPRKAYSWFCKTTAQGLVLNGHEVIGFDYKSHSIDKIHDFLIKHKFDILFTHLTFHGHHKVEKILEIFDEVRSCFDTKIIHTMQDARPEPRYKGDVSFAFDLALVGQKQNIDKFSRSWNIPVYYWPYSSMTYDRMSKYNKRYDFGVPVFPGNPDSHQDRKEFLRKLDSIMKIRILRTKSGVDIREKNLEFSRSTPCVLGLCTRYDWPLYGYFEVRPWQYLGAGACMIIRPYKDFHKVVDQKYYYSIDSYSMQAAHQVRDHWHRIQKDKNTIKLRQEVFDFIQKYHSSKVRMQQTIEVIEGKREKLNIFLDEI